jgi:hypothetical protein
VIGRTPVRRRKRLTQSEALEQARAQIKEAEARPKPKRAANDDSSETRDRERWVVLPKHLAAYMGEQAVVSQGWLWTHRLNRHSATTDSRGTKHIPVELVCLGPVAALDPNYKPENKGPGQSTVEGDKTPDSVLDSDASCSIEHLSENGRVLSPLGGRPKKNGHDDLILQLAAEGKGTKAIARALHRDGILISSRTVARRLAELRARGA